VYSVMQRLRSIRHRFWLGVSERVRWSRGAFRETPAVELPGLPPEQAQRIALLRSRYQVRFESELSAATSLNNYEYLDILDRAFVEGGLARPRCEVLCDVGCASFWYATTLAAFFRPRRLIGVEVEGYRLFKDGRTRIDYARGYLERTPGSEFIVADYRRYAQPADVITAWFPFLTPTAILAWRLPLSLLRPDQLFHRMHENLKAGGMLFMVNHGAEEGALAAKLCSAAGLRLQWQGVASSLLSCDRGQPPVASCWGS